MDEIGSIAVNYLYHRNDVWEYYFEVLSYIHRFVKTVNEEATMKVNGVDMDKVSVMTLCRCDYADITCSVNTDVKGECSLPAICLREAPNGQTPYDFAVKYIKGLVNECNNIVPRQVINDE